MKSRASSVTGHRRSPVEPASSLPITLNGFSLSRPISCGATNCVASSPAATQTFCVVDFIFLFLIVHSSLRKVNFE
ncbi:hypothetical protein OUZ56_015811 [Daphnia magna]|uniref:Uncharacterized protein n=1 Tax=Daphnia magna TaxID=35525 RepID=A0ABR0AP17_9CRUS|nr:hypothetical protein OUZ56_015811 [Daphnia magna]